MKFRELRAHVENLFAKETADMNVIICTLEGEYPVGVIEITEDSDGNKQVQINSSEPVYREPWE